MYYVKKQNSITTGKGLSAHEDLSINVSVLKLPSSWSQSKSLSVSNYSAQGCRQWL